ncbi:MAG: CoA pyrophosphatase, partial [Trueperaceae bacterium]
MTETELARLRARLQEHRPLPVPFATDGLRRAAVLVPLLLREEGAQLLFTVRSASLPHHAGQIAFPGGGGHDGETPERTACREAREEVGLDVPEAALLGRLSPLPSPANYVAVPVVAALPWPARLTLDPGEVAESFTVPLRELLNIRPTTEERPFRGSVRVLHRYLWRDRD